MRLPRRLLVLAAFAFWQGGFTFYAGVVVPLGTGVLGGAAEQARVTRLVAWYLNLSGAAALAVWAVDVIAVPRLRRARWATWAAVALVLAALAGLHPHLDALFHGEDAYLDDRAAFRVWHRTYLWLSTVQWGLALLFALLTLAAWRAEDRGPP